MRLALLLLLLVPGSARAGAAEIMARVAGNQDRAEQLRSRYVYRQSTIIRVRDSSNRLVREERTTYDLYPSPEGTQRKETSFEGRYLENKNLLPYTQSGKPTGEGFRNEADAHIAHNLRDDLTAKKETKDGISANLFPLTSDEQTHYTFQLKGEAVVAGIPVFRIAFQPKKGKESSTPWSGEALIDRNDYQPVQVSTKLARGVPFVVKTALGTNFHGLGFTVAYRKLEDGVWFPASYGAEFDVRILFVYSRKVSVSLTNTDFKRTSTDTSVTY